MANTKAIQIIGTQRSGSNLLRLMLNQISEIDAPHPPHVLERFYPLLPKYGDLADETNFKLLIDDVCRLIEYNPVPWEGVVLDREAIRLQCSSNSLVEIFIAVYNLKAQHSKAAYWCCKSMSNMNCVDGFESVGFKPIYIHLYRDGRDVALSFKKAIVGPKHTYHIAKQWNDEQLSCLHLKDKTPKDRYFSICYEELLLDPEAILIKLCEFLKVPYSSSMMSFYRSSESKKTASSGVMWENVSQPIIKDNSNKFLNQMSSDDLSIFESVAGSTLQSLNYELYSENGNMNFTEADFIDFNQQNEQLKQEVLANASAEDIDRKEGQKRLLQEIASRTLIK